MQKDSFYEIIIEGKEDNDDSLSQKLDKVVLLVA